MSPSFRKLPLGGLYSLRPTFLVAALILGLGTIIWLTTRPESSRGQLHTMRTKLRARGEALSQKELAARSPRWDLYQPFTNAANSLDKLHESPGLNAMGYASNGVTTPLWQMEKPALRDDQYGTNSPTWQELTDLMEQAEPLLQQVRTIPTEPLANHALSDKMPVFGLITLSQWFSAATVVALHQGNRASALQNLEAGIALAQISRHEPDHICQIGRSAVITITIRPTWEAMQRPGWTEPELSRLQAAWESVTPLSAAELALKGDLALGGDWDEAARHLPANEPLIRRISWPFYLMMDAPSDQLFCLSYRWDGLQVARAMGRHEPWTVLKPQAQAIGIRLNKMVISASGHWIPKQNLPKIDIIENSIHNETARQLLITDIAIRRFELSHNGAAPTNLAELSPDFLKAPSYDPMTGNELLYRAGTNGTYLVYSTGEDGRDDGGDATPINGNPPGLWNAKDVVWPAGGSAPKSP